MASSARNVSAIRRRQSLIRAFACFAITGFLFCYGQVGEGAKFGPDASASSVDVLFSLLQEHRKIPKEILAKLDGVDFTKLEPIEKKQLERLSPAVLDARVKEFNGKYLDYARIADQLSRESTQLAERLAKTPLSDFKNRSDLELKAAAQKTKLEQALFVLALTSINANDSLQAALKTVAPQRPEESVAAVIPKMPGVFGGSLAQRQKSKEIERSNLTPVDDDFYKTQLGQKLEKDLGGRPQYWSYDYGKDELYVKQGSDLAKVVVFEDQGGIRFIRTRMGPQLNEMRSEDARIDMTKAEGRFLTGDRNQETLFGKMPSRAPRLYEELPPGHSYDDGHDHGPPPPGWKPHKHDHSR